MATDTGDEPDRLEGFPHPREAAALVGHHDAQAAILDGLHGGRLHHAWLIGGPEGIGKATFAYQVAKCLLGNPGRAPHDLMADPSAQASRLVANLAHPDLVVLRRQPSTEKKGPTTQIPVDTVRRALEVLASTASGGGWRVCIVDSADDLNASGANALLKVIEEPPPRAIFLIVAHQPGRVLPTIRSRCRKLMLRPLAEADLRIILAGLPLPDAHADIGQAVRLAEGSVRRALARLDPETAALIAGTMTLLGSLPDYNIKNALGMAEKLAGRSGEADFSVFVEAVEDWVSQTVRGKASGGARHLAPIAEVWDKLLHSIRETDTLNLDRRPVVLSIFQDLADAVMRMRAA